MKIIFLDIDGVLNTSGMADITPSMEFNPAAMLNLKRIAEETDAYIVISSAWRLCGKGTVEHDVLMGNLKAFGLHSRIVGKTGDDSTGFNPIFGTLLGVVRGSAIWEWLVENAEKLGVEAFVIIDDIPDMGMLNDYLSVCNYKEGITDVVRERTMQILSMQTAEHNITSLIIKKQRERMSRKDRKPVQYEIMSRINAMHATYEIVDPITAIISITDIGAEKNTFYPQFWLKAILELQFDDVLEGAPGCITKKQAAEIADFAKAVYDGVERFIVHCEFGQSRSAGVAAALSEYFEGHDSGIFSDKAYSPNITCYHYVLNTLRKGDKKTKKK